MATIAMKYKVVSGVKPGTSQTVLRPVITQRESVNGAQLVKMALESGNCRGQFQDILGQLNGFTEGMQALCEKGKACTMSSWIRVAAMLTGTVTEERKLTSANKLHLAATALADMKKSIDDFSWTNVNDSGVKVKINNIVYVGGSASGYLKKGKQANITGRNLQFDAALGDTLTIAAASLATPVSVTPTESDYSHIRFALPASVAALADNAELTITLTSRGGVTGASSQVNAKTVVLLAADPVPTITNGYPTSYPTMTNRFLINGSNTIVGTNLANAKVYVGSVSAANELTISSQTATSIVFGGCGLTAGAACKIIAVNSYGNGEIDGTAIDTPSAPTMTKAYAESNPSAENHIKCFEEVNDLVGTGLENVTGIKYTWMSGGEEPVEMEESGTITEATSTLLKFKMPEVQFGTNGNLVVTWVGGDVTSSFTVQADVPE